MHSFVCNKTYSAVRSGGWFWHRVGSNGIPLDHQLNKRYIHKVMSYLPFNIICWYYETFFLNKRFDHELYGIKPNFRCLAQAPDTSDLLPNRIISGRIVVKRNIERFLENGVIFMGKQIYIFFIISNGFIFTQIRS
jgi:dimethylaniline monooxygenase (N-oxide forming)